VGTVLRNCDGEIPWWRVVGAGGSIRTPPRVRQVELLRDEGVSIVAGKVTEVRNR
jgi:alkylated DNA nucleotide flippase Atl1